MKITSIAKSCCDGKEVVIDHLLIPERKDLIVCFLCSEVRRLDFQDSETTGEISVFVWRVHLKLKGRAVDLNMDTPSECEINSMALLNFILTWKQDIGRYGTIRRLPFHLKLE
jgi:hypothetical protein